MKNHRKKLGLLAILSLLAAPFVTPLEARAQTTLSVQVGAPLFFEHPQRAPADGMRFYAPTLNVHKGDVINFQFAGFHTATLIPANTDVSGWAESNAGGIGKPWSFVTQDPDDTALDPGGGPTTPSLKLNNAVFFPSDPTCGAESAPCDYQGNDVVNSGFPLTEEASFAVAINANPGDTVWAICLIHPHMRLRINVVPDGEAATAQAEIDSFRDAATASDSEEAGALHEKLLTKQTKHRTATGKVVWDAWAGYDIHAGIALDGMYPRTLKIKKGQTVRWHFSGLIYEDHTVSFPRSRASAVANEGGGGSPSCDPDGDAGPGPDNPPDMQEPPFCADPTQLEFDISPTFAFARGNGVFRGSDFESSGVIGANFPGPSTYDLRFAKRSQRKGFKYMCMIHGRFMSGTVKVR
jgi:plastocyanin